MCLYSYYLYLPCGHLRWIVSQYCDYHRETWVGPFPSILYGGNPPQLCKNWHKVPGPINYCPTTHYPCRECDERPRTSKPLPEPRQCESPRGSVRGSVKQTPSRGPTIPIRGPSLIEKPQAKRGPPTTKHAVFDGSSKPAERPRPVMPVRKTSRFQEELSPMMGYADLDEPIKALTLVPGVREKLAKEVQKEMRKEKAKGDEMERELRAREEAMWREKAKGDEMERKLKTREEAMWRELRVGEQRIKGLMAALYDEQ